MASSAGQSSGRDPSRRERKYEREKRKRDLVSQQFYQISSMLGIDSTQADRTTILERLLEEVVKRRELLGDLGPSRPPEKEPAALPSRTQSTQGARDAKQTPAAKSVGPQHQQHQLRQQQYLGAPVYPQHIYQQQTHPGQGPTMFQHGATHVVPHTPGVIMPHPGPKTTMQPMFPFDQKLSYPPFQPSIPFTPTQYSR